MITLTFEIGEKKPVVAGTFYLEGIQLNPKVFDIMLPLREQVAIQVSMEEETPKFESKILDDCKERASDVRMPHEASICIYMISESA